VHPRNRLLQRLQLTCGGVPLTIELRVLLRDDGVDLGAEGAGVVEGFVGEGGDYVVPYLLDAALVVFLHLLHAAVGFFDFVHEGYYLLC